MEHRCCSWYRAKPAVEEAKKSMGDRQEVATPDGRDGYVGDGWCAGFSPVDLFLSIPPEEALRKQIMKAVETRKRMRKGISDG